METPRLVSCPSETLDVYKVLTWSDNTLDVMVLAESFVIEAPMQKGTSVCMSMYVPICVYTK